jgi:hypothetical protein
LRYGRIIAVIIIIVAAYYGYSFVKKQIETEREKIFHRYAAVISEVSLAAELYREKPDSFLIVRDSILSQHNMTIDSIEVFKERLSRDKRQWAEVWKKVKFITDSMADDYLQDTTRIEP